MSDVKDILGLSRPASDVLGETKPKPKEAKAKRPEGMSREAFALLGDSHPITPTALANELKKGDDKGLAEKRKQGPVVWRYRAFHNSARTDGLHLRHWTKASKDALVTETIDGKVREKEVLDGNYKFAQCNKHTMVHRYDDEEWDTFVAPLDAGWTRAETDYLLDLVAQFDHRFLPIADRYDFPGGPKRGLEDLKARYYGLARALVIGRGGGTDLIANEWLVKHPFDAQHELARKEALELLLSRRKEEDAREDAILESARAIELCRRAEAAARRPPPPPSAAAAAVDYQAVARFPEDPGHGVCSLFDVDANPAAPPAGVYLRSVHTAATAAEQIKRLANSPRQLKMAEALLGEAKLVAPPAMATRSTCGSWLAARAEAIASVDNNRRAAAGGGAAKAAPGAAAPATQAAPPVTLAAAPAGQMPPSAAAAPGAAAPDVKPLVGAAVGAQQQPLQMSPHQGTPVAASAAPSAAASPLHQSSEPGSRGDTPDATGSLADNDTPRDGGRSKRAKTKAPQKLEEVAAAAGVTPRTDKRARSARKYVDD
mmetsp:Transcript_18639/g.56311  ORF Transcript_18639/g.56311 Transcript_18639/m.56311 type:complete len:543 (-) Transcript_18639:194-1822(-)